MAYQLSTGLRNAMLDTGSFKASFDNFTVRLYNGTPPADADAALSGNTLLTEFFKDNDGSTRLTWNASANNGTIERNSAEAAGSTAVATGTATFFRAVLTGDTGGLSTTEKRIQGTVGTSGADLIIGSTSITTSDIDTLANFSLSLPAQ